MLGFKDLERGRRMGSYGLVMRVEMAYRGRSGAVREKIVILCMSGAKLFGINLTIAKAFCKRPRVEMIWMI